MAAICNRTGHYIFALWFLLSFCLSLFSSPNLSSRRLDVFHTSTHDVALVQIHNAGLKCAARGALEMQDPKIRRLRTIAQLCRAISSQLRHISSYRQSEKLVKQQCLPHMPSQYGELRPPSGWNLLASLGQTLLHLYRSLIRSKLDYGCIVYGSARGSYILTDVGPCAESCTSFVEIGCLPYFHTWCGLLVRIWDAGLKRAKRGSLEM